MKHQALFFFLLFLAACHTTAKLRPNDLTRLSGQWQLACSGPIGQPDALDCPEMKGIQQIIYEASSNTGKFHYQLPDGTLNINFKLLEESGKWFVYYVDDQGNTSKGEIVRLNAKELVLHYVKEGIMTVQRRVED